MDKIKTIQPASRPAEELAEVSPAVDCWKQIGVIGGDCSCPELKRYIHCRNCHVYTGAGAKLLDRVIPPGYREEWTRRLAEKKPDVITGKISGVIFRAGGEWLALPTPVLQEVAEQRVIHSLPHQRNNFVLGLVNVRGELLICLSMERLLGLEVENEDTQQRQASARLLVIGWHGQRQAFPVSEIFGIHRFHPQEMDHAPSFMPGAGFMRGLFDWDGRTVGLLNEEMLFKNLNLNLA